MENPWVRYIDRTYQQIKDSVLRNMQSQVPEITDHTESNLYVKMVGIWAGCMEMLGYYVDSTARELSIVTCRLYKSAINLAYENDYRVKAKKPAMVDLLFQLNSVHTAPITIPIGTIVKTSGDIRFYTVTALTIPAGQLNGTVGAEQISAISSTAVTGNGQPNQKIDLDLPNFTDGSATVVISLQAWSAKETLAYESPTSQSYVQTLTVNQKPRFQFGDGVTGKIVPNGAGINITYKECLGAGGNVFAGAINTIVSVISLPVGKSLTVTNPNRATGGADAESLEDLKYHIPRHNRTLDRAITEPDYRDIAELANGVARAGVTFNCGKEVIIYIVPDGGGLASNTLCTFVQNYFQDKKSIGRKVVIKPCGVLQFVYEIDIQVKPAYGNLATANKVSANVMALTSYIKQKIGVGMQLSDVYETIDGTEGVEFSKIVKMTTRPCAFPVGNTVLPLAWSRITKSGSVNTLKWRIVMTNGTEYQLLKDNIYVGTFTVGTAHTFPEIDFTVNTSSYAIGDQWEFTTYAYYGTVTMVEPSIPEALISDIVINAVGGI